MTSRGSPPPTTKRCSYFRRRNPVSPHITQIRDEAAPEPSRPLAQNGRRRTALTLSGVWRPDRRFGRAVGSGSSPEELA
jgi:hypothetical protein